MRRRHWFYGAALTAAVVLRFDSAAAAKSKDLYVPSSTTTAAIPPLEAVATIRRTIDARWNAGWPCGGIGGARWAPISSYVLTGRKLTVRCPDNSEHVFVFSQLTQVHVLKDSDGTWACARTQTDGVCIASDRLDVVRPLADAFHALSLPRQTKEPAQDSQFQAQVAAARSAGDRSEDQRRTVVQADALLKENRTEDAMRLYEEGLARSPDWALGRYNLALIYASLELLPEAITEMKRYLYLAPQAQDARAARDQVYAWEALLPR